ncbi:hypothetical protein ATCV1_z583R [Acanthocystis turfacea chlorella virus 1]|uniref:Uncharacterized protein z583R n=1 Tax=Chlorovirus heliozoae TaxID=322019 RepID=A7K9J3_9PHYC|nr:hypothetical protein ATCV1_z583R [Acanthocystis turfacea chlorella virus 1]ABT16717.1 hypothetical protein ATCV1_z583R [Acanthocystis turfacea chlorella virus 1]
MSSTRIKSSLYSYSSSLLTASLPSLLTMSLPSSLTASLTVSVVLPVSDTLGIMSMMSSTMVMSWMSRIIVVV